MRVLLFGATGLSVRVLPLLRREVQMSDVRVEGLNLRLNRDKQGHGNWEDLTIATEDHNTPTLAIDRPIADLTSRTQIETLRWVAC